LPNAPGESLDFPESEAQPDETKTNQESSEARKPPASTKAPSEDPTTEENEQRSASATADEAVDIMPASDSPTIDKPRGAMLETTESTPSRSHPRWTWAVIGTGGALAIAGGALLFKANDVENEWKTVPTDSIESLNRKASLEQKGQRYTNWGTGLLIAGAVTGTLGTTLLLVLDEEEDKTRIRPLVSEDGIGVTIGGTL
jgi:hypothetical protein